MYMPSLPKKPLYLGVQSIKIIPSEYSQRSFRCDTAPLAPSAFQAVYIKAQRQHDQDLGDNVTLD